MIFHDTNEISQNFIGIILCFHSVAMYYLDFRFGFRYFQKLNAKFQFHLNRLKISKFWTWEWRKLKNLISQLPIQHYDTQHNNVKIRTLTWHNTTTGHYVECLYAVVYRYGWCLIFHYHAECRVAECHGADWVEC